MKILDKITEYGFYLYVFLLPWQTRWIWRRGILNNGPWEYGTFSLYATEILFLIILVLAFIRLIGNRENRPQMNKSFSAFYFLLLVLILLSFVSIFWAINFSLAFYAFIKLIEGLGVFALAVELKITFKKIAYALTAAALVQSILAIYQSLSQSIAGNKWLGMSDQLSFLGGPSVIETPAGRWLRAYGSLPHPNILGGFLAISLVILIGLAFVAEKKAERYLIFISSIIISLALFLSFSRESWLAYFLAFLFLFYIILKNKNQRLRKIMADFLIITLIVGSLFGLFLRTEFLARTLASGRLESKSTEERINYSNQALELISENSWYRGVGLGNYTAVLYRMNNQLNSWDYQPAHNLYLLLFAELGIGEMVIILFLIFKVIKDIRIYKLESERKIVIHVEGQENGGAISFVDKFNWWFLIFSSILIIIGMISFFDHYFGTLYFGLMLFWLFLGLWFKNFKAEIHSYK